MIEGGWSTSHLLQFSNPFSPKANQTASLQIRESDGLSSPSYSYKFLKTKSLMEKGNIQKKDISIKVILKMTNLMAKEKKYYLKKIQFI